MSDLFKKDLKSQLLLQLSEQLLIAKENHQKTVQAAFHDEAKAENAKDTRSTELSYLARGYAQRVEELQLGIDHVRQMPESKLPNQAIHISSLVILESESEQIEAVFIAPFGAGVTLDVSETFMENEFKKLLPPKTVVKVITPQSPLGEALIGKEIHDSIEIHIAKKTTGYVIRASL